jgi:hypothetical protein|tara:strand:- start:370 stop:534 length:165 start_codon:yes stop_codon:yes gene_type:complete
MPKEETQEETKEVEEKTPQHIHDEALSDETRQRMKELQQIEMFDDPYMNWSGHR